MEIKALKVRQWLPEWDRVRFDSHSHRRKPEPHFYLFTLPASQLKLLSGIYRRTTESPDRSADLGIQRRHDRARSDEIAAFVRYGFPWSELSPAKRESGEYVDLQKPGWLPTAIVVNILRPTDKRRGEVVAKGDLVTVKDLSDGQAVITLPISSSKWSPSVIHPIEVIDGQHRLWAFEGDSTGEDYELPVVAFHGLDISWQAYLFWSINIKPKRINASLAFDLYPLLRTEDWLEKFEGHPIYRETRAQELTEALWSHPKSPWHMRINMLGEPGLSKKMVSQSAWIRSLMATYIKAYEGRGVKKTGGLFGAPAGRHDPVIPWGRTQQAAFLIFAWRELERAIRETHAHWATQLRAEATDSEAGDAGPGDHAFGGDHTLLNTDQGVRGFLYVSNDLCYLRAREMGLEQWSVDDSGGTPDEQAIDAALKSLSRQDVAGFLRDIAQCLSDYDWRSASASRLSNSERTMKLAFRGSGGYREIRRQLLLHLASKQKEVGRTAESLCRMLGFS